MNNGDQFFVSDDRLEERTGKQLMDIAVDHLGVAIVDVMPVPDTVEDLMNGETKHVFIIEATTVNGNKIELMLADSQVEHLGRACSIYVLEETRRKMKQLGIDENDEAIAKVIRNIIELMEGLDGA